MVKEITGNRRPTRRDEEYGLKSSRYMPPPVAHRGQEEQPPKTKAKKGLMGAH